MTVKVGDKVRIINAEPYGEFKYKNGDIFYVSVIGHNGESFGVGGGMVLHKREFEVVGIHESTPSVTDLLANLALRVSELERHNREQAYEINELYKAVSANE